MTPTIAQNLIHQQFPQFAHLSIKPVDVDGHDNRTFRLGNKMLIRMPSAKAYALKVPKEQEWLPKLAQFLSLPIPKPLHMGQPSNEYPWCWSIYEWLEGKSANTVGLSEKAMEDIAIELARFLKELHLIKPTDDLLPGQHNWWRGDHVSVYDTQARSQIAELKDILDEKAALALWESAISSRWSQSLAWIHGDLEADRQM